jgi:branched-subunit amino acid ABC-type transport system permease component
LASSPFVTCRSGGFGSVPGALVAGLLIGVIESVSAYLDRRRLHGQSWCIRWSWFPPGSGRKALMGKM